MSLASYLAAPPRDMEFIIVASALRMGKWQLFPSGHAHEFTNYRHLVAAAAVPLGERGMFPLNGKAGKGGRIGRRCLDFDVGPRGSSLRCNMTGQNNRGVGTFLARPLIRR